MNLTVLSGFKGGLQDLSTMLSTVVVGNCESFEMKTACL
jgi:hypothetical protein